MDLLGEVAAHLPAGEYGRFTGVVAEAAYRDGIGERVDEHLTGLEAAADDDEFVDIELARLVAQCLHQLIGQVDSGDPDEQALVAGAVEYFVLTGDADDDVASPIGLEDDARVANAVARVLGRVDLVISLP